MTHWNVRPWLLVAVAMSFAAVPLHFTGYHRLGTLFSLISGFTCLFFFLPISYVQYRRAAKRADASGLNLVNTICTETLSMHSPAGGGTVQYCNACPGAPVWPCSQYLYALSMSNESDKKKLHFLRNNVEFFIQGPEGR